MLYIHMYTIDILNIIVWKLTQIPGYLQGKLRQAEKFSPAARFPVTPLKLALGALCYGVTIGWMLPADLFISTHFQKNLVLGQ